jgi:hypothetical protein
MGWGRGTLFAVQCWPTVQPQYPDSAARSCAKENEDVLLHEQQRDILEWMLSCFVYTLTIHVNIQLLSLINLLNIFL